MYIKSLITLGVAAALASCGNDVPIPSGPNDTDQGVVTVAGSPAIGETLTASVVDADGVDSSTLVYQWSADGEVLEGETASTLLITDALFGQEITVFVQYADDDGVIGGATSESTASVSTVNIPGTVTVTGTAQVGETLTATIEDGNGVPAAVTSYQWAAAGEDIDGATAATYELQFSELDAIITINVVYTDNQNFDEDLTSTATAAVIARENTEGTVTIAGSASVGSVLTATVADVNGITTSTIAYQWLADNAAIAGATDQTFSPTATQVDTVISVTAAYTDDEGNAENLAPAAPTDVVTTTAVDLPGSVAISGDLLSGETLTATITDANGVDTANATFQWQADGADILGATNETLLLSADELGTAISVSTTYTDNDGFPGSGSAAGTGLVYSFLVNSETTLRDALAAAVEGDWIALDSPVGAAGLDDYADMSVGEFSEIELGTNNLVLTLATDSTAVISGATCLTMASNSTGITIDGLVFESLTWDAATDCLGPDASINIDGADHTFSNNQILSEAAHDSDSISSTDPFHYVALRGVNNTIERNLFSGKDTDLEGSAITIFINDDDDDNNNIVQFNLFRDFIGGGGDSGGHAIQVGRSTGNDSAFDGEHSIQYNRFDNVPTDRRIMRVQGGGNLITANTIVNSSGMIALEDGLANVVTFNVIVPTGDNGDDGGISFAPLGHTVTDNYIANVRTTSNARGALLLNTDPIDGTGNTTLLAGAGPFTLDIARNTIVNARSPINLEFDNCGIFDSILNFTDNLVLNVAVATGDPVFLGAGNNGSQSRGIWIDAFTSGDSVVDWNANCALDAASTFTGNRYYGPRLATSENIAGATALNFDPVAGDNIFGETGVVVPEFTIDATGFVVGAGDNAGVGVDTSGLFLITEDLVGPGSTWVPGE